jgi:hypothetical protein
MKTIGENYKIFWENPRYDYCYIAVDIHGTIFKPSFEKEEMFQYYPMAKQCLRLLSENPKVKLILWSGCYTHNFMKYIQKFESDGIKFDYINENPECENSSYACFDSKFYFDLGIDDKFGFDARNDWKDFYSVLVQLNINK